MHLFKCLKCVLHSDVRNVVESYLTSKKSLTMDLWHEHSFKGHLLKFQTNLPKPILKDENSLSPVLWDINKTFSNSYT